jgi:hypothetical protein
MRWPFAPDRLAETEREPAGEQTARQDEREDREPAPEDRRERGQHKPDEARLADVRETDEEIVEPWCPVVDDPALESRVEGDQAGTSCFVDSIRC